MGVVKQPKSIPEVENNGDNKAVVISPHEIKEKENKKDKSIDCDCFVKELKNISDEEMFYDSVTSYREYQERVQASKENNVAKLEQLKQKHAKRNGLGKKLDIACGGK